VAADADPLPGPRRTTDDLDALLLGGPRRLTRDDVAERSGVPLERARRYWQALGFADTQGTAAFTDADVEALRRVAALVDDGVISDDMAVALLRALGHSVGRLASWQVDLVLDQLAGGSGRRSGLSVDEAYATAERLLPELAPLLLHVWRLQLAASVDRVVNDEETLVDAAHLTVGFADLVGFTELARRLDERALGDLVEAFEHRAADCLTAAGARVVKTLGDEVLFVAAAPEAAADGALALVEQLTPGNGGPELRVGLATGLVVARMGDFFGTTVNLANRLTSMARPSTVLVDPGTAEDLGGLPGYATRALGPRPVRGLGVVEPYVLTRG
jgi:adenylate cyclase